MSTKLIHHLVVVALAIVVGFVIIESRKNARGGVTDEQQALQQGNR